MIKRFKSTIDKKEFDNNNIIYNARNAMAILYVIIGFEICMILKVLIGEATPYPSYIKQYLVCYIFLLLISVINLCFTSCLRKHLPDKIKYIDLIITIYAIGFTLWGIAISILDSHASTQILVYLTVIVCLTSLLKLRPWLFISLEIGGQVLLMIGMIVFRDNYSFSQALNLTVFTTIYLLISVIKYNNTVNDFYKNNTIDCLNNELEKEKDLYEQAAKKDTLTGLYSRYVLKDSITKIINNNQEKNLPLVLLCLMLMILKLLMINLGILLVMNVLLNLERFF